MCTVLLLPGGYPLAVNKYFISYHMNISRKSIQKIHVSSKFGKNKGYSTCRPTYVYHNISFILIRMGNVSDKNTSTHFVFNKFI